MSKKQTLRQMLREEATSELEILCNQVVDKVQKMMPHYLPGHDVMRLISSSRNQALKDKLVTKIANEKEQGLLRIYAEKKEAPSVTPINKETSK